MQTIEWNKKLKIESWMKKYSRGIFSFHWFSNIIITDNGQKTNEKEIEIEIERAIENAQKKFFFFQRIKHEKK